MTPDELRVLADEATPGPLLWKWNIAGHYLRPDLLTTLCGRTVPRQAFAVERGQIRLVCWTCECAHHAATRSVTEQET